MSNQRLATLLLESNFVRSISVLVGGTALAQGISILASPILTRLYTPDEYGVLGIYAAVLGCISVIAGLCYELAIPLPYTNGAAANVLALACLCIVLVTTSVVLTIMLFGKQLVTWTNTQVLTPYLWLIPVGVALNGFYQCFNYWAIRKKAFSRIARTRFQQSISSVVTQVGLGWVHSGSLGLIIGQVIGQSAGLIGLIRDAVQEDRAALRCIRKSRIVIFAARYRRFMQFTTLDVLAIAASIQLPLVLLAVFFLPANVGLFLLALRVMQMPLDLIGRAVGQVFFPRAVEARRKGELDKFTLKVFRGLVHVGVGPLILIAVIAPDLFAFVFGEPWRAAGTYARWMTPWLIGQFVFAPLSVLTDVTENQAIGLYYQLIFSIIRIGFLLAGISSGSVEVTIAVYSVSGFLFYFTYGILLMYISSIKLRHWISFFMGNMILYFFGITLIGYVIRFLI